MNFDLISYQIANFFMKKFNKPVLVFTTHYLTGRDSELYFNDLTTNQKELITSLYCKTFDVLLEKLLDLDENPFTKNRMFPKCIIIESMVSFKFSSLLMTLLSKYVFSTNGRTLVPTSKLHSFISKLLQRFKML